MSSNQRRQPRGTSAGGQFAPDVNQESTVELTDASINQPGGDRLSHDKFTIDGHKYTTAKLERTNDTVSYMLDRFEGSGGWRIEYDRLTRRAKVRGVRPTRPTAEWRDRGEADIRAVLSKLEPDSQLFELDGKTYLVYGPGWPLSASHISGINSGQMMLTSGKSEDEVQEYVDLQRSALNLEERDHPERLHAIEENHRYIAGVEIAARMGRGAAEANTIGAAAARGL